MEFLSSHWHCVLPLIGLVAYLLCARRDASAKAQKEGQKEDKEDEDKEDKEDQE
ncbi:MAG: hypothetical protein LBJ36_05260 [Synergistaceae bacterium]|jgi:F0F1-type ATP synthase assembly protein I|nr:hypothetical protein [Synergistaceae bacterium]